MKKLTILLLLFSLLFADDLSSSFAGGSGTSEDPYQISTIQQLQNMNLDLDAHYILINDIDASETRYWNDGKGFEPVGTIYYDSLDVFHDLDFKGRVNGMNYTINNLYINRPGEDYVGLFGYADVINRIHGITLKDSFVKGHNYVGGLIGYGGVDGSTINCSIYGNDYVGGLVGEGYAKGYVYQAIVIGNKYIGGGLGYSMSDLDGLYFNGRISGIKYVGGIIGYSYRSVTNSYSEGYLSSEYSGGGITGVSSRLGIVENSYSTMGVAGSSAIGGLIGELVNGGLLNNSFFTGCVYSLYYDPLIIGGSTGAYSNLYAYNNGDTNYPRHYILYGEEIDSTHLISDITYFYNISNPPMDTWGFEDEGPWVENKNGLPTLGYDIEHNDLFFSIPYTESSETTFQVPIVIERGSEYISTLDMDIHYESDYLTFSETQSDLLSPDQISQNSNTISIRKTNSDDLIHLQNGDTLLVLTFNAAANVSEGDVSFIEFSDNITATDSLGAEMCASSRRGYIRFSSITQIADIPQDYRLHQNYANPFNPATTISYDLPQASNVTLSIYDITGRLIQTLVDQQQGSGQYSIRWDASHLSSGVYIYRLQAGDFAQSKKMLLIK
ncbi:MAG: T9SS type A sorting domain-containing protein [Candidatus Marinimicrobia bacterium]|nr:T9SS type A sorting domain-containing protein [Candidatus Neomarinimicrobiota bacterium]